MKRLNFWLIILAVAAVAIAAPAVLAAGPGGTGPNDPLSADGSWQTVPGNGARWYFFDYPGDKSKAEVDLDTYGVPNIQLGIFTADQAQAFVADPTTAPVGWGTPPNPNSQAASHDLVWLGGFNYGGRFFAVVLNRNANAVAVRMTISGSNLIIGPTPTPTLTLAQRFPNPLATPVMTGTLQGKLVFQDASGGNIYTVNGDGSNLQRVTYGLDPNWSPDGNRIAFARWNVPAGLYVVNADGSNEQMVFGAPQLFNPQWSPDGTHIVFTVPKGGSGGSTFCFRGFCFSTSGDPHFKLGLVDLSGVLTEPRCSNHCFSPTWSPEGTTVIFADPQFGLLATDMTPDSGPEWNVYTQNSMVQSPSYSPDGRQVVFQVKQHDHWEINVMNADGSNVRALTAGDPLSFAVVNNVAPTWSPDGQQVLFLSDRGGKWEFFVVNTDGTGLRQVLKNITDRIAINYNFSNERVIDWKK